MTLPMAIYFHRITIFALPVNVFILPLLLVLMPAALLTLLALFAWPSAAVAPGHGCRRRAPLRRLACASVRLVRLWRLPHSLPAPLAIGRLLRAARGGHRACAPQRDRSQPLAAPLGVARCVLAALAAVAPRPIEHPRNALLVEAIDVGQGDSLLLITPDGKTLLVDGGGFGGGPRQAPQEFDIGEEVVSPALWARGIRHLDAVALSHAHSDHMGGLPAVLRNFHPDELWVGNNPRVEAYDALLDEAAGLHVQLRTLPCRRRIHAWQRADRRARAFPDYQPGAAPANNDSLVLHAA